MAICGILNTYFYAHAKVPKIIVDYLSPMKYIKILTPIFIAYNFLCRIPKTFNVVWVERVYFGWQMVHFGLICAYFLLPGTLAEWNFIILCKEYSCGIFFVGIFDPFFFLQTSPQLYNKVWALSKSTASLKHWRCPKAQPFFWQRINRQKNLWFRLNASAVKYLLMT